jgi:hypothetical protein
LKLSEALLATDELLLELIPKYFAPEALSAVVGARELVTKVLSLPFDFIFLTGSVGVGKVVMRAAAENLTPVLLELGGQNPAIVDQTANIPDAAKKIVWGAMAWGGQWCTSPGYAVVHESVGPLRPSCDTGEAGSTITHCENASVPKRSHAVDGNGCNCLNGNDWALNSAVECHLHTLPRHAESGS